MKKSDIQKQKDEVYYASFDNKINYASTNNILELLALVALIICFATTCGLIIGGRI